MVCSYNLYIEFEKLLLNYGMQHLLTHLIGVIIPHVPISIPDLIVNGRDNIKLNRRRYNYIYIYINTYLLDTRLDKRLKHHNSQQEKNIICQRKSVASLTHKTDQNLIENN